MELSREVAGCTLFVLDSDLVTSSPRRNVLEVCYGNLVVGGPQKMLRLCCSALPEICVLEKSQ